MSDNFPVLPGAVGSPPFGGGGVPLVLPSQQVVRSATAVPSSDTVVAAARPLVSPAIRQAAIALTANLGIFDVTQALTSAGLRARLPRPMPDGLSRLEKVLYVMAEMSVSSGTHGVITAHFNAIDWSRPDQVLRALGAISELLWLYEVRLEEGSEAFNGTREKALRLRRQLKIGGFHIDEDTVIHASSEVLGSGVLASLRDPSAIRAVLTRIAKALPDDPALAIGSAKELIEATAKTVLAVRGQAPNARDDLPRLVHNAERALGLHPSVVLGGVDGAPEVKRVLGQLTAITNSAAELRNKLGTGHGVAALPEGLRPRHGRLAVAAANTWCFFVLDTLADPEASWRELTS